MKKLRHFLLQFHALRSKRKKCWFRAKNYGWGWYPVSWEGWVVMMGYLAVVLLFYFSIEKNPESSEQILLIFIPAVACATAILIGICYFTGESPELRWRGKKIL